MKYIGTKKLETERLILRRIVKEDAYKAYENWCSSDNVSKYVLWNTHKNIDETINLFEAWANGYDDLATYKWIVELKDNHEVIGTIDVNSKKFMDFGACEIGYCYGEKFWNKGYGTEALRIVIKFLFEECEANTIFAEYIGDNIGSGKVMEKAGMKFEGILRKRIIVDNKLCDLYSYSITRDEYKQNI